MYRQPDRLPGPKRSELEEMARAGRRRLDEEREARSRAASNHEDALAKQSQRELDAIEWRFAQRASRTFERLVNAQAWLALAFVLAAAWCASNVLDGSAGPARLAIVVGVAVVAFSLLRLVLRNQQRSVLAAERAWARDSAFGMTGHLLAIGKPVRDKAELRMIVQLETSLPKSDASLYSDALASISPTSRLVLGKKRLVLESGELDTGSLMPWCRDVVGMLLPKLEASRVQGITLTGATDAIVIEELD